MLKIKNTKIRIVSKRGSQINLKDACCFSSVQKISLKSSLTQIENILRRECRAAFKKTAVSQTRTLYLMPFAINDFPTVGLTRIITQEIHRFLTRQPTALREIVIVAPDKNLYDIFKKEVHGYLNHLLKTLAGEPYVTVDVIIETLKGIVIIERSNPPYGWALPGGFVDRDESLEIAVRREAMEETHLTLKNLRQFHTYSDPKRDARFHTIDTVFVATGVGRPRSGDDAKNLKIVEYADLLKGQYAFDHKQILKEYLKTK